MKRKELQEHEQDKDLSAEVDEMFRRFRREMEMMFRGWPAWGSSEGGMPVNLKDEGDHYKVQAELPGVKKDDIEVNLDNNNLTISAQCAEEEESAEEEYLLKEMGGFSARRTIPIPEEVNEEGVKAKMNDGILTLDLPKKNPTKIKKARSILID